MKCEKLYNYISTKYHTSHGGLKRKLLEDFSLDKRQALFLIMFIILLSFLLRIYKLSAESLWFDEVFSVDISKKSISGIVERTSQDVHPPLYYIILYFWMRLFGDSEFSIRFISVIFGAASTYVIYRFGKLISGYEAGILSAFILSISLFHIRYSQEARFYSLLTLLVLLSNYYFVKLLKEHNTKYIAIYAISTAAMSYTHIFGLFYLISQNIYYLFVLRKNIKSWILIQSIVLFLFLPWIAVLIKQITTVVEAGGGAAWISRPTALTLYNTFKLFAGSETNLYIFTILFIVGLTANKFDKQVNIYEFHDKIFLLLWLFLPILVSYTISLILQPIYVYRYVISSLPALILIVSKGILNFRKRIIVSILLIILIISAIYPIEQYYKISEKEQWREIASYIENNKGDNDIVLLYVDYTQKAFKYYYKNDTNFVGIYDVDQVKNLTKGYERIWLILSHDWSSKMRNNSMLIKKILSGEYIRQDNFSFRDLRLEYYLTNKYEIDQIQPGQSRIIYLTDITTKIAQPFIPAKKELDAVQLRIAKPSDEIRVYIQTDNKDDPSGNTIGNIVTAKPNINTNFTAKVGRIKLDPGNRYWILVEKIKGNVSLYGGNTNNRTIKIYNSTKDIWQDSGYWNPSDKGLYFKTLTFNKTIT